MNVPVHQPELYPVEEWHQVRGRPDGVPVAPERWAFHHHAAGLPLPPAVQLAEAEAQVEHLQARADDVRQLASTWQAVAASHEAAVAGSPDDNPGVRAVERQANALRGHATALLAALDGV